MRACVCVCVCAGKGIGGGGPFLFSCISYLPWQEMVLTLMMGQFEIWLHSLPHGSLNSKIWFVNNSDLHKHFSLLLAAALYCFMWPKMSHCLKKTLY